MEQLGIAPRSCATGYVYTPCQFDPESKEYNRFGGTNDGMNRMVTAKEWLLPKNY
jgi:hypothetical protein